MKKIIPVLLASMIAISACSKTEEKTDWNAENQTQPTQAQQQQSNNGIMSWLVPLGLYHMFFGGSNRTVYVNTPPPSTPSSSFFGNNTSRSNAAPDNVYRGTSKPVESKSAPAPKPSNTPSGVGRPPSNTPSGVGRPSSSSSSSRSSSSSSSSRSSSSGGGRR